VMTFCMGGLCVTCIFTFVLHSNAVMDAISVTGTFTGSTPEAVRNLWGQGKIRDNEGASDGPFRQGCVSLDGWDRPCRSQVRLGRR
jgi:hypothetical protein